VQGDWGDIFVDGEAVVYSPNAAGHVDNEVGSSPVACI
jgi:hypothetical protein